MGQKKGQKMVKNDPKNDPFLTPFFGVLRGSEKSGLNPHIKMGVPEGPQKRGSKKGGHFLKYYFHHIVKIRQKVHN